MAKVPVEAVSRNLDNAYLVEIKKLSSEVTRVRGAVKVAGVVVLPALHNVEDWFCPKRNGRDARSQMGDLEPNPAA